MKMAPLRCCSFNCRGWNNGSLSLQNYINSIDLCFVQEHWLFRDHLNVVRGISPEFLSVGVSGMNCDSLCYGRPYGGCSILYRKSLSSCITPLDTNSDRFCGIKLCDLSGLSYLLICVYMPTDCGPMSYSDYLNTLGDLEGFIECHNCDAVIVAGDFNVDFDRGGQNSKLLEDFILDLKLHVCDLDFRDQVCYTYERDDGHVCSWIDHVLCSQHISDSFADIHALHSGSTLSDHFPLFFNVDLLSLSPPPPPPTVLGPCHSVRIDWSKVSAANVQNYCDRLSQCIDVLPSDVTNCVAANCTKHQAMLDSYAQSLVSSLLHCASECFPTYTVKSGKRLVGWNDSACLFKKTANFWYKVWKEAGCPKSGVLSQIKKTTKSRYKYWVRRLKRRQNILLQKKLALLLTKKNKKEFWSEVRHLNRSHSSYTPVVDGVSGDENIANLFATKSEGLLNTHTSSSHSSTPQSSLTGLCISEVSFSDDDVLQALFKLRQNKSDGSGVFTEHLKYASSVISEPLSAFFTSVVRHGYMPLCIRDSVLTPIPKGNNNTSCSQNYRAIALASILSKTLEHLILTRYESFFNTSCLQFGFKPGLSTSMCTGALKSIVSRYINRGSAVFGCLLDASKAFDLVNHEVLFHKLVERGLPLPVVRFLSSWYRDQQMCVRWGRSLSRSFCVSNGVRQGSVLSPVLFSVYLDSLLDRLADSSVGCYWGHQFAGALCYADDLVLLAPTASALRQMLSICDSYATSHGLVFNAKKTQLICFHSRQTECPLAVIRFNGIVLQYQDQVSHLGHILTHNLDDKPDILRAIKDLHRKANCVLYKFGAVDPFVKSYLLKSYCLSLYGCPLWSLSSPSIKLIEIALNKLLRRVWNLPHHSHSGIVHCTAKISHVSNIICDRFCALFSRSLSSQSDFVRSIFLHSSQYAYSFIGYNSLYGNTHYRYYSELESRAAHIIRQLRSLYGLKSPCENIVSVLSC